MIIKGYGPPSTSPYIPSYVLVEGRGVVSREGVVQELSAQITNCEELNIPPAHWIGLYHDGRVGVFKDNEESDWRAKTAMATVQAVGTGSPDPEKAISILKVAANLIGLDLGSLMIKLEQAKRNPKEDLVEVFKREFKPRP